MYIVFEGIDGSGKSHQAQKATQYLREKGYTVQLLTEPNSSPIGDQIREMLKTPEACTTEGQRILSLLFAADRLTIDYDDKADYIISDRSYISSLAYQGNEQWVKEINKYAREPDFVFLLDAKAEAALQRSGQKDTFEDKQFLEDVRARYKEIIKDYSYEVYGTEGCPCKVTKKIQNKLNDLMI